MSSTYPSEKINVSRLAKDGERITVSANGAVLDLLTRDTPASEIFAFQAEIVIRPWKLSGAEMRGNISAQIAQECVATLEPMESELKFGFERLFLPAGDPVFDNEAVLDGELVVDAEGDDLPDVLEGNIIDVWEVLLEELNLQIEPFPRKADFEWQGNDQEQHDEAQETVKPFADLKALISEKKPQEE